MRMIPGKILLCGALGALLLALAPMGPHAAGGATLRGQVTGLDGRPLAAMQVEVRSRTTGTRVILFTDTEGRYTAGDLPPGSDYEVSVGDPADIHRAAIQDRVALRAGETTDESFRLTYTVLHWVGVHSEPSDPIVNLEDVGQHTFYSSEFLQGLPLIR